MNVLFLCTGNSARSIIAEALLDHLGGGRFRAFSAGSRPAGRVQPLALETLSAHGIPAGGLCSKGWEEFAAPGAPAIDVVITVCDAAAAEACPVWPSRPAAAHWSIPDPAAVDGDESQRRRAYGEAFAALERRIRALVRLADAELAPPTLTARLREIGDAP